MSLSQESDIFEHFRILRREDGALWELGRGAMGVTFKAIDTRLDSLVALKVIGARALSNAAAQERFRREARAAASLRHPNIASVHHFGQRGTDYFYAMEYIDGESISAVVKSGGPLAWATALDVARQTALALTAVHARQLVHRDIKPDNLMLTHERGIDDGTRHLKLIDFGLAKSHLRSEDAASGVTTEGFLGTPVYASPEQCREQACDIRSDVYSLGITLWFMLTGKPPFTGNLFQLFHQHMTKPPPLGALPAQVPPAIHGLLTHMLSKDPGDRPQTPLELRHEIDACLRACQSSPDARNETLADKEVAASADDSAETEAAALPSPVLPVPLTRFFGREKELATLGGWFRDGHRLVTLTGPGGAGKTRLALEVARSVQAASGRQPFFVDLSDLTDPRFLARRVFGVLRPAVPLENADAADAAKLLAFVVAALSVRPSFLLLDNFEQLAEGGAQFVGALLSRVDSLCCMVTSRRRLDLSGEREFALPTLALPPVTKRVIPLERLAGYAGVQLFCDRAQAVRADFALGAHNADVVAELCRRLEGIPLAIELAAARVEVLTPRQIVTRLGASLDVLIGGKTDVAARHRTLRAAIDWSFGLLPPEQRLFFARLSVFRGGWTAEAAVAALEDGADEEQALARLGVLRRCSLIVAEESGETMRYRLLETIRQYAGEQLARLGDEEAVSVRRRHRDFFLALAQRAEPELRKPDQARWLALLETEHENFRAALARSNDGEPAQLSLAYNLHRFWMIHDHVAEGRDWFARALKGDESGGADATDPLVAKAHNAAGVLAWSAGDLDAAQTHLKQSLLLFHAQGNTAGTASAMNNLGLVACERSDYAAARVHYEKSLVSYRAMNSPTLVAAVLNNLGQVLFKEQKYSEARRCLEESLALDVSSPDQYNRSNILAGLGEAEAREGNIAGAYGHFAECLTIRLELGDNDNFELYWRMAAAAAERDDELEAARMFGAADALRQNRAVPLTPEAEGQFQTNLAAVSAGRGAAFDAALSEGKCLSPMEIIRICREKIP